MKSSWMLVAGLLFGLMGVFVKLGAPHFSHVELVFYRSLFGLLMVYGIMRHQRISLATRHWRAHLWRGISGSVALALFFYCITVLPLATAVTLNYTAPLFLTLFTMLVFKDRFHPPLTIAIALGFCGVVLLLQPALEREQLLPGLLGLISGFLAGVAYLNVKQLAMIGEPDTRTVFYFSLTATLGSGVWILFDTAHAITLEGFAILFGLGSSATLAQLAMTRAYRTGRTLVVGSLAYSTIVFASLFGMLLWDETLGLASWLGMAFIIASGVLSLRLSPKH
ncbi:DMT family transporter [Candidatus Ferrigenium straubiae]|jgi:drug/metabolite transporter (DMT)-like permease|uniref:DMT family transporter n=1 Tax=Candidatus Ferrigenium straubiae TaxID=2919506 RepID=UPI003F4AA4DC